MSAQSDARSPEQSSHAVAAPGPALVPLLRRRSQSDQVLSIQGTAAEVIAALDRVQSTGHSEALLLWPQRPDSVALLHALASLTRLHECDARPLLTVFYPWNRNATASQRTLLVDKEFIASSVMGPLNRLAPARPPHAAFGYVMALHSLRHLLATRKPSARLRKAVEAEPGLLHPTLFDMMPQSGAHQHGLQSYHDQFLRRLRHHTWIGDCADHMAAATHESRAPFFLYGLHSEAATVKSLRSLGLDPKHGGRSPNLVLLDLTRGARERLQRWRQTVPGLLGVLSDVYGENSPAVLALTDDPFVLQGLRWEVLNRYDVRRRAAPADKRPALARVVLNSHPDILEYRPLAGGGQPVTVRVDGYGSDVLNLVEAGLKLRRAFSVAGDHEHAVVVSQAIGVAQALVGFPGTAAQLYTFLTSQYDGHERQSLGSRFDHHAPLGKLRSALQRGLAGAQHAALSTFLTAFEAICTATATSSHSRRLFDEFVLRLVAEHGRALLVCSSEFICGFIAWRLEHDDSLSVLRDDAREKLTIADRREALELLSRPQDSSEPFARMFFLEPHADDLLHVLVSQAHPAEASVLLNLARCEQTLRRVRILLELPGAASVTPMLKSVTAELERVLGARASEIPDLDVEMPVPHFGLLDLTTDAAPAAGPRRVLTTSTGLRIRAYDGSELAVYDPDAMQVFSRKLARDLQPDDRICVFSPDFVAMARARLTLSRDAPDILALYHSAVLQAVARLEGKDISSKVAVLKQKMLRLDSTVPLPSEQGMRYWIDIADIAATPRDKVTPHAPRERSTFVCFMKALGISEDVARHYWDLGIFWTRSMRIRTGFSFHQVFMGILIDPHGTASWLPPHRRDEVWRIYETAEQHVVTVVTNRQEAEA